MNPLVRRVFVLILILICVALLASLSAISMLYHTALAQQETGLLERAQREARVIGAILAHEEEYAGGASGDTIPPRQGTRSGIKAIPVMSPAGHVPGQRGTALEATIGILRAAHKRPGGFGETGEYLVGQRQGDSMAFLIGTRQGEQPAVRSLPMDTSIAVPMRRALQDSCGTVVGRDYRGATVMAGYAAVGSHDLGVVAKMDLAEVRGPYVRAGLLCGGIALMAVLLGTLLFFREAQPMLRRITESEERFQQLSDSLPQFVWTCRPDGRYDFLSEKWVKYTGIPAEPQLGFGWLEQLHPDDREPTLAAWNTAVASGSDFHVEFRIRRHDGEYRWFDTRAVRLHDAHGRTAKWLGTNTDITERKQAELEQARLNEALRIKNVELEQHIYAVSHDLRTPLVSVQGFANELKTALDELSRLLAAGTAPVSASEERDSPAALAEVRAEVARLLDEEIPTSLRFILAGVEKMGGRLAGLLRLSRLGRAALKLERLDMNQLAAGTVAAQAYRIQQAGAKVELGDLPPCRADTGQVDQVLANLLDNAIKYRDPARPLVVKLTGQRQLSVVTYRVEDNGIGMPPEVRQRIFELFYQANPSRAEGEGLGLTIVRRALRRLGGEIVVESELGKGSRFSFVLPAVGIKEG